VKDTETELTSRLGDRTAFSVAMDTQPPLYRYSSYGQKDGLVLNVCSNEGRFGTELLGNEDTLNGPLNHSRRHRCNRASNNAAPTQTMFV